METFITYSKLIELNFVSNFCKMEPYDNEGKRLTNMWECEIDSSGKTRLIFLNVNKIVSKYVIMLDLYMSMFSY